jgi:hypothetical protein
MRVLFSPVFEFGNLYGHRTWAEYMTDSLFHGFRSLLGNDVAETPRLWHLYAADRRATPVRFDQLYGRGFTLYGLLPDDSGVDREDFWNRRVAAGEFDLVVVTVHCSAADGNQLGVVHEHVSRLAEFYPKNHIAFIDTVDSSRQRYDSVRDMAVYFKRELEDGVDAHPVAYSIPAEKFAAAPLTKTQDFGTCVPYRGGTYVFEKEEDYYADYRRSRFGYTCKKGGWNTMRHYEILACGSVPYFPDIGQCPSRTLWAFPKNLCKEALELPGVDGVGLRIDESVFDHARYEDLSRRLFEYSKENLTTTRMAQHILDVMSVEMKR